MRASLARILRRVRPDRGLDGAVFEAAFERVCGGRLRARLSTWAYRRGTLHLEFSHHAAVAEASFFADALKLELNRLLNERLARERAGAGGWGAERPVVARVRMTAAGTEIP